MGTNIEQSSQLEEKKQQFHFPNPAIYSPLIRDNQLGRKLWPRELYRSADQLASAQVVRKLWSWNINQSWDPQFEPQVIRRLWPSDAYRPANQTEENQIVRTLWQYADERVSDYNTIG